MNQKEEILFKKLNNLNPISNHNTYNPINKIQIMQRKIENYFDNDNYINNILCLNGDFGSGKTTFINDLINYNKRKNERYKYEKDRILIKIIDLNKYELYENNEKYIRILFDITNDCWCQIKNINNKIEYHNKINCKSNTKLLENKIENFNDYFTKYIININQLNINFNYYNNIENENNYKKLFQKIKELNININEFSKNTKNVIIFDNLNSLWKNNLKTFLFFTKNILKDLTNYYFIFPYNKTIIEKKINDYELKIKINDLFENEIHIKYLYELNYNKLNVNVKDNFYLIKYLEIKNNPSLIKKIINNIETTSLYKIKNNKLCYSLLYRILFITILFKSISKNYYDFILNNAKNLYIHISKINEIIQNQFSNNKYIKKYYKNNSFFNWQNSFIIYQFHHNNEIKKFKVPLIVVYLFSKNFINFLNHLLNAKNYQKLYESIKIEYDKNAKQYIIFLKMEFNELYELNWILRLFNMDNYHYKYLNILTFKNIKYLFEEII